MQLIINYVIRRAQLIRQKLTSCQRDKQARVITEMSYGI